MIKGDIEVAPYTIIPFEELKKATEKAVGIPVKDDKGKVVGHVIAIWASENKKELHWKMTVGE